MESLSVTFANSLAHYAQAVSDGRIDEAVTHATMIPKYGEMIVIHPDFVERFKQNCPNVNPERVLDHAGRLLRTIAEFERQCRAHNGHAMHSRSSQL